MNQPRRRTTWLSRCGVALDAVAKALSPEWGVRRMRARAALAAAEVVMHYHSGAANDRNESHRWLGSRIAPDAALTEDRLKLLDRSEELYRDDSLGGAVDLDVEHVVGTGFMLQAKPKAMADVTPAAADQFSEEMEFLWDLWRKGADVTGRVSLWRLSRLAWRSIRYAGETLTVLSDVPRDDSPLPLCIEVIDPKRLETPPERAGDMRVRNGVEFDAAGRIIKYFIRREHPDDPRNTDLTYDELPPERVIHLFEPWFCDQSRGYGWFARGLRDIKDAKDLQAALVMAAQIEACFAAFRQRKGGNPQLRASRAATTTENGRQIEDIIPGSVTYLDQDEQMFFANPTKGNAVGTLQDLAYRRIAAGMNLPYELLMRDWRGISFAGGRIVLTASRLTAKSCQQLLAEGWFSPIYHRACDEAVALGRVTLSARDYSRAPWLWRNHRITPPAWSYSIEPGKEVEADIKSVEANFKTMEQVIGEHGADFEEVLAQRELEEKALREKGLKSPASTRGGGAPENPPADGQTNPDESNSEDSETPA